jgi:hypothetical protein
MKSGELLNAFLGDLLSVVQFSAKNKNKKSNVLVFSMK